MKQIKKFLSVVLAVVMAFGALPLLNAGAGEALSAANAGGQQTNDDDIVNAWLDGMRGAVSRKAAAALLDGAVAAFARYQKLYVQRLADEMLSLNGITIPMNFTDSGVSCSSSVQSYADGTLPAGANEAYTPVKISDYLKYLGCDRQDILEHLGRDDLLDADLAYTGLVRRAASEEGADLWNDYFMPAVTALYSANSQMFDNLLFDYTLFVHDFGVYLYSNDVAFSVSLMGQTYTMHTTLGIAAPDMDVDVVPSNLYKYSLRPFFIALLKSLYPDMTIEQYRQNGWISDRLYGSYKTMRPEEVMGAVFAPLKVVYDAVCEDPAGALCKLLPTLSFYLEKLRTEGFDRRGLKDGIGFLTARCSGAAIDEDATKSKSEGQIAGPIQNALIKLVIKSVNKEMRDFEAYADDVLENDPAVLSLDEVVAAEVFNEPCSAGTPFFDAAKDLLLPVLYNGEDALYLKGERVTVPESEEFSMPPEELFDSELFRGCDTLYDGSIEYIASDRGAVEEYLHALSDALILDNNFFVTVNGFTEYVAASTFATKVFEAMLHLPESQFAELTLEGSGVPCEALNAKITCERCGGTVSERLREAGEHAWGDWTVEKEVTCTAPGSERRVCLNDPSHTETRAIEVSGHLGCELKRMTVTADGIGEPVSIEREYVCPGCGETHVFTETGDSDHYVEYSEPYAEGWHIQYCGHCSEAIGLELCSYQIIEEECSETETVFECAGCGRRKVIRIEAVCPHALTTADYAERCGVHIRRCLVCGEEWEEPCVPKYVLRVNGTLSDEYAETVEMEMKAGYCALCQNAAGHLYQRTDAVAPTCVDDGYILYECGSCGERYEETVPAGHAWGAWTVVDAPTFFREGKQTRVCPLCREAETGSIDKLIPDKTETDENTGAQLSYCEGAVPADVRLVVEEEFDGEYYRILDAEKGNFRKALYSLTLEANGEKVQPDGCVLVRLPIPAGFDPQYTAVYHIPSDGAGMEKCDSIVDGGCVCFETTHFSAYAIVDESTPVPPTPAEPAPNCVCGKYHAGPFAWLIKVFHRISFFFRSLFVKD